MESQVLGILFGLPCEEVKKFLRFFKATMKKVSSLSNFFSLLCLISCLEEFNKLLLFDI